MCRPIVLVLVASGIHSVFEQAVQSVHIDSEYMPHWFEKCEYSLA